jgi:hypothetical protein
MISSASLRAAGREADQVQQSGEASRRDQVMLEGEPVPQFLPRFGATTTRAAATGYQNMPQVTEWFPARQVPGDDHQ